jgi:hypothetical protein
MSNEDIDYISDYEMKADEGRTYTELNTNMPYWGILLHNNGNRMPENELEFIFENGLLLWYIRYFTDVIIELINFKHEDLEIEINNPSFYHFKKYSDIAIKIGYDLPDSLQVLYNYSNYQDLLHNKSYYRHISFNMYIIDSEMFDNYVDLLNYIYNNREISIQKLIKSKILNKIDLKKINQTKIISHEIDIINIIKDTHSIILRYGIIFQRWKVVVEKLVRISRIVESGTNITNSIIIIDRILTRIQEMIFYHVRTICYEYIEKNIMSNELIEKEINLPDIYEKRVYKIILKLIEDPNIF